MPASLEQLRTVPTRAQTLQWYLDQLTGLGFNATAWQSGTPQRTLLLALSRVTTNFAEIGKQVAELCFNDLARGAALEAYSIARFGNTPKPGTKTKYTLTLTNGGTVPHTFAVGQLLFSTKQNVQYRNTTGGTVASGGGTLAVTVEAVKKGATGNVADNSITVMVTPLAGVSCTNLAGGLVSSGEDPELDATLRLRNSTKWARLSLELTRDAHINIALESHPNIRRAEVDDTNPRGAGTIDVYIAGASNASGPVEIEACQNYFAARALQTETYPADPAPAPGNTDPTRVLVKAAPASPVNVTGTIYYASSVSQTDVQARVEAAIDAYIRLAPIGGYPYPSPGKVLPKNNLENAILKVTGVRTVVLTDPSADVVFPGFEVATPGTKTLTYTPTT
jgi:uncharacterized phage protein gp47/JayE